MSSLRNIFQPARLGLCAFTAAFLCAAPAWAELKTQWVEYNHGEARLKGYIAWDDSKTGKRPAVFMIHDKWGMSENTQKQAEQWSKLGYVVFAADIYGVLPQTDPETSKQTAIYRGDRALMKARTQAGFDTLLKNPMVDPAKVALIGYCFGGTVAVEFGSTGAPLAANIVIHGSYGGHEFGWAKNSQGHVCDPARRRGPELPARNRQGTGRAARGQNPVRDATLQRHRPRFLQAQE